jgi:hypothetical protein
MSVSAECLSTVLSVTQRVSRALQVSKRYEARN